MAVDGVLVSGLDFAMQFHVNSMDLGVVQVSAPHSGRGLV
jgi:hypothetical protein